MEVHIAFDGAAVIEAIDDAIAQAAAMRDTLPAEMSAWQEQDMGRKRADTQVPDPDTAFTIIRPRGEPQARHRALRRPLRTVVRRRRPGLRRPILRAELYDRFRERMGELLKRTFAPWV